MSIKPGDGSAREQAASCQRVLGGCANLCQDFATKRYRSNVINWGMVPFTVTEIAQYNIQPGDKLYIPASAGPGGRRRDHYRDSDSGRPAAGAAAEAGAADQGRP